MDNFLANLMSQKIQREVYSFSSNPEGVQKNYQRALKLLSQIFGSETSDRVDNFFVGPLALKKCE